MDRSMKPGEKEPRATDMVPQYGRTRRSEDWMRSVDREIVAWGMGTSDKALNTN